MQTAGARLMRRHLHEHGLRAAGAAARPPSVAMTRGLGSLRNFEVAEAGDDVLVVGELEPGRRIGWLAGAAVSDPIDLTGKLGGRPNRSTSPLRGSPCWQRQLAIRFSRSRSARRADGLAPRARPRASAPRPSYESRGLVTSAAAREH